MSEYEQMVADCEARESRLSDWERSFIDSIGAQLGMNTKDEPAFPRDTPQVSGPMSLRDYFAAKALPGVLQLCCADTRRAGETQEAMLARTAYELADAMLAERAK